MRARTVPFVICVLAVSAAAFAQTKDKPGTKDQPLVSRYKGSVIWDQVIRQYDAYRIPMGVPVTDVFWNMQGKFKNQLDVEGKITSTVYVAPAHSSALLVPVARLLLGLTRVSSVLSMITSAPARRPPRRRPTEARPLIRPIIRKPPG
jgi:hypothetical protein